MIETIAMRSGTTARNDANTNVEHRERAEAAEQRLDQHAGALAVRPAVLEQRVEAGQVHRLAGDGGVRSSAALAAFSASGFSPKAESGSGCG